MNKCYCGMGLLILIELPLFQIRMNFLIPTNELIQYIVIVISVLIEFIAMNSGSKSKIPGSDKL